MIEKIPEILVKRADELEQYYRVVYPSLAPMVRQCFLNTIETTVKQLEDGSYFVITGDIPAMWLRDSSAQVRPYVSYACEDRELDRILCGIISKQLDLILMDPYANAFNESLNGMGHQDLTQLHPGVWERKYEVDSLCAPFYLMHDYWKKTEHISVFDERFPKVVKAVLEVFQTEQEHGNSPYYFQRFDCVETDTLPMEGKGNPVVPCGMTWSGFRPSDDCCVYGYLIPSNMMAVKALSFAAEMLEEIYVPGQGNINVKVCQKPINAVAENGKPADDTAVCETSAKEIAEYQALASQCRLLAAGIQEGIHKYAAVTYPGIGEIYAFETDGNGNYMMMDDANSPSLLAIPYLGYADKEDEMYLRTRSFILSGRNPYYYQGRFAEGIGSPHTPEGYVWCIGIIMRALTSVDREEIFTCLDMLAGTHASTNYMHESFDPDQPEHYTRPWFAWANTLFAELLDDLMNHNFFENKEAPVSK